MDGKTVFGSRVAYYLQARPDYPSAVLTCLQGNYGLTETAVLADIGSGTGKLSHRFLENGNMVYGVEPNDEMRQASAVYLQEFSRFTAVNGTAEATTLPTASIDFVVAGQAAHWFDREKAATEFRRIRKPDSIVALVWNQRDQDNPLIHGFNRILHTYRPPTPELRRPNATPEDIAALAGSQPQLYVFPYVQQLDFTGLVARMLSISLTPLPGEPNHEALVAALQDLFDTYQENGRIHIPYRTELYVGG